MTTEFTTYFECGSRLKWTYPGAGRPGDEQPVFKDGTRQSIIFNPTDAPLSMEYDGLFKELSSFYQRHIKSGSPAKGEQTDFSWLTYLPGKTTVQQLQQADVLTGPMSGCLVIVWKPDSMEGQSVCHVGTNYDDPTSSRTVKQEFAQVITPTTTGFNPINVWEPKELSAMMMKVNSGRNARTADLKLMGLVTAASKFYSICMFRLPSEGTGVWCAGGIKEVPAMTSQELKQKLEI